MSVEFSLSETNEHYNSKTPQGLMLSALLEVIKPQVNLWYADTFSLPSFENLKKYYKGQGIVVLYCWWDPVDSRLLKHIDDIDLDFIIVTPDPTLIGKHSRIETIKWRYQYGFHNSLINSHSTYDIETASNGQFLCMMRNHKPERLCLLQELWKNDLLDKGLVSYLGQVNTTGTHGRESRTIDSILKPTYGVDTEFEFTPDSNFAKWCKDNLPIQIPNDVTQTLGNNTDFNTPGNRYWYANTSYSVILETYWAKTQFLTEKTFKPIVAGHPFINLGNRSTELLKEFGFNTYESIFGSDHDSLPAKEKIDCVIEKLNTVKELPVTYPNYNRQVLCNLEESAKKEITKLAKQVKIVL